MRRYVATLALGAAALVLPLPAAAAEKPTVTLARNVEFPDRVLVLTTPKAIELSSSDVRVTENSSAVRDVDVVPASTAALRTFGTVLVVDASNSMRGKPIVNAVEAARIFTAQSAEGHALGLVTFNRTPAVVLEPTTDREEIEAALADSPTLAEGTRLYDALAAAIDVLDRAGVTAGSIVALTDGRDTGSAIASPAVVARARAAGVRIFTVGLRSEQFTPGALRPLSRPTGGRYTEASSATSLAAIYRSLSKQLAREYLVRYRSVALPSTTVGVAVDVARVGTARTTYVSPALQVEPAAPYHRSYLDRFFSSPLSAFAVALLVALLAAYTVRTIFRRNESVQKRVSEFTTPVGGANAEPEDAGRQQSLVGQGFQALDRALARASWWDRFKSDIEVGEFPIQPVPYVIGTVAATIFAAVLLGTIFLPPYALFAVAVPFLARQRVRSRLKKKRDSFAEQLPDNLLVMAASMRAGHSFVGSLQAVVDEADEPSKSELRRAVSDEQVGVSIEEGLVRVARRMDNGDLEQVALVAALQRETGGNTAAVLDTVVDTVRERFELRRTVRTLTAQGRMSRWILTLLPVVVFFLVSGINRSYMEPLVTTQAGQVMLVMAIVLVAAGSYLIKRIVEIEL